MGISNRSFMVAAAAMFFILGLATLAQRSFGQEAQECVPTSGLVSQYQDLGGKPVEMKGDAFKLLITVLEGNEGWAAGFESAGGEKEFLSKVDTATVVLPPSDEYAVPVIWSKGGCIKFTSQYPQQAFISAMAEKGADKGF